MDQEIYNRRLAHLKNLSNNVNWTNLLSDAAKADDITGDRPQPTHSYFGTKTKFGELIEGKNQNYFNNTLQIFKAILSAQLTSPIYSETNVQLPKIDIDQNKIEGYYDALILMVGMTLEPLMLSTFALEPKNLYPIVTHESQSFDGIQFNNYTEFLVFQQNVSIKIQPHTIVPSFNIRETFKSIRELIHQIRNENSNNKKLRIALDITGGKKSMDASAFLAVAIEEGIDIYYVDYEGYNVDKGKPESGTEFLNKLDNPYDIYNIQLLNQAKELFKNHNYQAAFQLFSEIENKISPDGLDKPANFGLDKERSSVRNMKTAAKCYMFWDRFDYINAEQYMSFLPENQSQNLIKIKDFNKINTKKKRYESEYLYNFIIDRYLNAKRKSLSQSQISDTQYFGEYHDAIFRYAQSVEILIEAYLTKNISGYDPDDKTKSVFSVSRKQDLIFKGKSKSDKDKDGNSINFEITPLNNNDLKNQTKNLSKRRDEFAHVYSSALKSNLQEAEDTVKKFIEIVFNKPAQTITDDMKKYAFCTSFNEDGTLLVSE